MITKKHKVKPESIKNMTRELGLEEGPETELHIDLLKTTLKWISNKKTPGHNKLHCFWFKKLSSIHDRNKQMLTKSTRTQMDDQRKEHIDPKGPEAKRPPQTIKDP